MSERLHIRISTELKNKAKELAKKQNRTLSSYIINLIIIEIRKEIIK